MCAIQPDGPYFLLGGHLADSWHYEIATQLQSQGECGTFLALLDSYPAKEQPGPPVPDDAELLARLLREAAIDQKGFTAAKEPTPGAQFQKGLPSEWTPSNCHWRESGCSDAKNLQT
jgi:thioesterase domain-containing protein